MSVESYLDSIRKNTSSTTNKTASLDNTMKDLLNYESLKKAVTDGVEKGNKDAFKRLAELSKKILSTSDATNAEIRETNQLLKLFYASLPKTSSSSSSTSVTTESWVKALAEVLEEFGDKLPEKFQTRLKYDIVSTAASAGADPKVVMQQVNQINNTQVNQTVILENIYSFMEDRQKLLDRQAEARKPIETAEKKDQATFWQTRLGKVIDFLGGIFKKLTGVAGWLGALAVGLAVWGQLSESLRKALQGIAGIHLLIKGGALFKGIGTAISNLFKGVKVPGKGIFGTFFGDMKTIWGTFAKDAGTIIRNHFMEPFKDTKLVKTIKSISSWFKSIGTSIKTFFAPVTKLIDGFKKSKLGNVIQGISKLFGVGAKTGVKTAGSVLGLISKLFGGPMLALVKGLGKLLGPVGMAITIVSSVFDFIEGFTNTKGTLTEKITGGLWNVVTKFFKSIWDLVKWIPKILWNAIKVLPGAIVGCWVKLSNLIYKGLKKVMEYFNKKGIKGVWDDIKKGCKTAATFLINGLKEMLAGVFDAILDSDFVNDHPMIANAIKAIRATLPESKTMDTSSASSSSSPSSSSGNSNLFAGLDFNFGADSSSSSNIPAAFSGGQNYANIGLPQTAQPGSVVDLKSSGGINKASGVVISPQVADFYKRSGLTDQITSGTRKAVNARDWTGNQVGVGSISQRSHASGNKFDIGMYGKNTSQLFDSLKKLALTPGMREAHVEGAGSDWRTIYNSAISSLLRQGLISYAGLDGFKEPQYSTKAGGIIGWWGARYSPAQHIDVLVDPKKSGAAALADSSSFGTSTTNLADGKSSNPLVAMLQSTIVKAYNEQVKLLSGKVKAPDQLAAEAQKNATQAIQNSLAQKTNERLPGFNKKDDINDSAVAMLKLVDLA